VRRAGPAAAALALVLYAQGFVRLRRRGREDRAPGWRAACFVGGIALIVLALVSPLDTVGEQYLLSAHMLQHVLIADAGIVLVWLGLRSPLLFFFLPRPALGQLARLRPLRAVLAFVLRRSVSLAVWCLVIAVWHVPSVYDATLDNQALHDAEHASFVLAGLLVWYQLLDVSGHGRLTRSGRVAYAVAIFVAGQVLALLLIFSFEPLYPAYAAEPERLLGLSPLTDQHLAGLVMMLEQTITLGSLIAYLLFSPDREPKLRERRPSLT
jgi:cytochrome c oxidase assembly factor CtaG